MNKVKGTGIRNPRTLATVVEEEERSLISEIGWREHLSLSEIGRKAIQEYIKNHGEGNPAFTLDQFQDPDFKAIPATMSPPEKWNKFIREHTTREEREKLDSIAKYIREVVEAKNYIEDKDLDPLEKWRRNQK